MSAFFKTEAEFAFDALLIEPGLARKVIIKSGAGKLTRGTVLGKITAGGKYLASLSAASDGSQVPDAILSSDVDATSADVEAVVYITGRYNSGALVIGAGHTLATVDAAFRGKSIFIESIIN